MSFRREKIKEYYLHDTRVENVFINEYMADAPGDYVKVYLFALMYAEIRVAMTNESIAKQLALPIEDVLKAWTYWEKKGAIRKIYPDPEDKLHYKVEIFNLKEQIYGHGNSAGKRKARSGEAEIRDLLEDEKIREMYSRIEQITGRPFEGTEPMTILSWIQDHGASPELVISAYQYCEKERKNSKGNYVGAVVKEWAARGLRTEAQVAAYLEEHDNRHYLYKRIFQALGFLRTPGEEEKRIMDSWFDGLGFSIDKVLEACKKTSGISNPNINYVNSVLINWNQGQTKPVVKSGSPEEGPIQRAMKSYDVQRETNEKEAEARREEVFRKVPRIRQIEEEIRELGLNISRAMLEGGAISKKKIRELKDRSDLLNNEKAYLLTDHNFEINYMDVWYTCPNCKDTGLLDTGERCPCFESKLNGK